MKVLWITNIPLPDTCRAMGWDAPVTGGWIPDRSAPGS